MAGKSPLTSPGVRKPGPPLPDAWKTKYLELLRTKGGYYRSARLVGVDYETALAERNRDPAFDQACHDARQERADLIADTMIESAKESGNPAGFIVELKAIRPAEYIEKHAVLTLTQDLNQLPVQDAVALLKAMLGATTPATQRELSAPNTPHTVASVSPVDDGTAQRRSVIDVPAGGL